MIQNKEDLETAINSRFRFKRDFVQYLSDCGFILSETIISNHLAGRKKFTEWHKIAYSFAFSYYDTTQDV